MPSRPLQSSAMRRPTLPMPTMPMVLPWASVPIRELRLTPLTHQRLVEGPRIRIVGRFLAQAMGTGQLCPAPALADRTQKALEAFRAGAGAGIGAPHMIDHNRQAQRFQRRYRLRQILYVDPELQVPAQIFHHERQHLGGSRRPSAPTLQAPRAPEKVECQAA